MSNHCFNHKTPGEQDIRKITFSCSITNCQDKAKYVDNSGVIKYCESHVPNPVAYAYIYQGRKCTYPNCVKMASFG